MKVEIPSAVAGRVPRRRRLTRGKERRSRRKGRGEEIWRGGRNSARTLETRVNKKPGRE